jgi:tetratricopeptide (TPR) repeat protein
MKPAPWPLPTSPRQFLFELTDLQGVAALASRPLGGSQVKVSGFAEEVQKKLNELDNRRKEGKLSVDEALNLSGCSLLLGDFNKAIDVLTPVLQANPKHFMVLANLANAYQGLGEYSRAIGYQQQALANWPAKWPGWNPEKRWWYRRAEKYYLTLLELRNREKLLSKPTDTLDGLFPNLPFADLKVKYRVGDIDLRVRDRLPPDVLEIVGQLVLWMPQDNRLLWMYAELLNARGEIRPAYDLMVNLRSTRNFNAPALTRNRRELQQAVESIPKDNSSTAGERTGWTADTKAQPAEGSGQNTWMPDWRQLGVGFGSGLLVGMLLLLQIGQLRKRFSGSHLPRSSG